MKARRIPNVHPKNGAWYFVKKNKWMFLSRIEEGNSALYAALAKVANPVPDRLSMIFQLYIADERVEIATATREKYAQAFEGILGHHFGHMRPDDLETVDVAAFLEDCKEQGRSTAGNRYRSALSSAYEWAIRHRYAKVNPCRGVRRNKERPSQIYVETDELTETYERASEALKHLLNGGYLSGMRLTDLMNLRRDQITTTGIIWRESKTGKENEMRCKPGLLEVFRRAIAHGDAIATKITVKLPKPRPLPAYVFVNNRGKKWTQFGVSSAMKRAKATFAFRQLRAKAQTDSPENVLGHEGAMRSRYTRRRKLTSVA